MNKALYDLVWGTVLRTTTVGHRWVYRLSGGKLGRRFPGGQIVVWITTLGRKSGQWRKNPLLAVVDEVPAGSGGSGAGSDGEPRRAFVVTGSNAGQAKLPGWVFNVRSTPEGFLEVDGEHWAVRFEEADGDDRDQLYARLTEIWSSYRTYENNAGRYIPVFRVWLLSRVSADEVPASA